MKIIATFEDQSGKTLTRFEREAYTAEEVREAIPAAYETFRRENPNVSLFDNVMVRFDKKD